MWLGGDVTRYTQVVDFGREVIKSQVQLDW